MTFCHQKSKHCFVACCASALGLNTVAAQEEIVCKFPNELQKGCENEGVPFSHEEVFSVVTGLGLSENPRLLFSNTGSFTEIVQFLKDNRPQGEKMMMFTKFPTNHCMRIRDISECGIIVMNPEGYDFSPMTWPEFEATQPAILVL